MGKATIASGGTDGLYTVDLDYGSEIITAQVAEIDAQIADRQADLTEAETAASDAQTALNAATNDVDNAITAYTADPTDANRLAMNAAATEAQRLAAEYRNAEARRQSLATIILSLQAYKSQLESVRTSETRSAWCVDYTEDATGEVATIEVPGEVGTLVIAPGGRAPTSADGQLVARGAQVSYQAYYNAAILPGWQRFVHPYRVGTLTAKDGDTGTVSLDAATSSAAGLQVRDAETITAPIQYMTCNGEVFEAGDRVVVNMDGPTIIGFESNPKQCPVFITINTWFNIRPPVFADYRVTFNDLYWDTAPDGVCSTGFSSGAYYTFARLIVVNQAPFEYDGLTAEDVHVIDERTFGEENTDNGRRHEVFLEDPGTINGQAVYQTLRYEYRNRPILGFVKDTVNFAGGSVRACQTDTGWPALLWDRSVPVSELPLFYDGSGNAWEAVGYIGFIADGREGRNVSIYARPATV